ncbi:flavodoxin [Spirochaetia bacterium]|nr:flavodoxin [Spirochaetia bacterium]GHU29479.1 flavodoxin [Spirochaetia bacterium]
MKTAICYFSGTGNGFDLAIKLNENITDSSIFYIPNMDINLLNKYERIVIISPVYCFGVPIIIKQFLQNLSNYKNKTFYGILHFGGFSGNAKYYLKTIFDKNNLSCNNIYTLQMPENYTLSFVPPEKYIDKQLKKSRITIELIAKKIIVNNKGKIKKNLFSFCDRIHEINASKWATMSKEYFNVTDKCNKCGLCIKICPTKNIEMDNENIIFKENCLACLACYHRCPTCSINYKDKTYNKKRYVNPNVDLNKME